MTRQEAYVAELGQLLFYMTPWDKAEALKTVNKLFEETDNEAELLNELGTPMKLAVTLHRGYEPTPEPTPEELAAREAAAAAAAAAALEAAIEAEAEEETEEAEAEAEEATEEAETEIEEVTEEAEAEAEEAIEEAEAEAEEATEEAETEIEEAIEEAEAEAEEAIEEAEAEAEEATEEAESEIEEVPEEAEIEEAAEVPEEKPENIAEAIEERVEAFVEQIEEAVEALLDPEDDSEEDDAEEAEEAEEAKEPRAPWVIEEKPDKEKIFAEIYNAATEAQSAVIIEEEPKPVTRRKARYLLLIPYTIFALLVGIPGTFVFAVANLAVTLASVVCLVAMVYLVIFHLFAAVDLGSKLILFGLSVVMLSLTVMLSVFSLWFLHNATLGFPRFLREVAMTHCYREVEVK